MNFVWILDPVALYNEQSNLSMLGLNLMHASKSDPRGLIKFICFIYPLDQSYIGVIDSNLRSISGEHMYICFVILIHIHFIKMNIFIEYVREKYTLTTYYH